MSCRLAVWVHRWLAAPLMQSQIWACVPFVVLELPISAQRPDWTPTSCTFCGLVLPPLCTPAVLITVCAPDGQLPLLTVTLLLSTLPRSPFVTFVLPFVDQLLVTVKLPMF